MDKLRARLHAVVETRYGGKAPAASRAAGLNPNAIDEIFQNPRREPKVSTLAALAEAFRWSLCEAAYWTLDQEAPTPVDYDPVAAIEQALRYLNVSLGNQIGIMQYVDTAVAQARASSSVESP